MQVDDCRNDLGGLFSVVDALNQDDRITRLACAGDGLLKPVGIDVNDRRCRVADGLG